MEKIIQEFRIIETDDGFRIEIKGDKEQLREFVMSLDPRTWTHGGHGAPPFPFFGGGPRMWRGRGRKGRFGPFAFAWNWDDDEEEGDDEDEPHHRKRGHQHHGEDDESTV